MKSVLHVPEDWDTQWDSVVEAVKANTKFQRYHTEYFECCDGSTTREELFYKPLEKMANAVLDVWSELGGTDSGIPQTYHVNSTRKLQGGIFNKANLSPDLVVLHKDYKTKPNNFHWANALHVLEVKPYGNAICDGGEMPRLIIDGEQTTSSFCARLQLTWGTGVDPIGNHTMPTNRLRGKKPGPLTTPTTTISESNPPSSNSRKRPPDESSSTNQPTKKSKTKSALGQTEESEGRSTPKPETQRQLEPANQVCRYLLEMFSIPLLRSHATVSLVDRDRLQLYHANHSVVLVSSAINFSGGDGLKKFIATIIAFRRLTPEQNGIIETLFQKNTDLVWNSNIAADDKVVQKGNVVIFSGNKPNENFAVNLGEIISRDPAVVGRSTVVVDATSDKWPETELVMKVSWPGSGRVPETEFLEKACAEAKKTKGEWAINHLPRVLHARDVTFKSGSTLELVANLFRNPTFAKKKFQYERRALRVIIQERLHSIKSLKDVRVIGQVFLDVACSTCFCFPPRFSCAHAGLVHRWLFDEPGILHRDLSFNNIMCRIVKELGAEDKVHVYGVLTDYDLSSWVASLRTDYTKTSQQRTGTPPYMAQELLKGTSNTHLYRHDVESLFYIMLLTCARHKFDHSKGAKWSVVMREGTLPYQKWFNERDYDTLGSLKGTFFTDMKVIELSPAFEDIRKWLLHLQYCFSDGFELKNSYKKRKERGGDFAGELTPFDDETLGGKIDYSSLTEPIDRLTGNLKGLTIRYKLPPSPPPTPADVAQADT